MLQHGTLHWSKRPATKITAIICRQKRLTHLQRPIWEATLCRTSTISKLSTSRTSCCLRRLWRHLSSLLTRRSRIKVLSSWQMKAKVSLWPVRTSAEAWIKCTVRKRSPNAAQMWVRSLPRKVWADRQSSDQRISVGSTTAISNSLFTTKRIAVNFISHLKWALAITWTRMRAKSMEMRKGRTRKWSLAAEAAFSE